MCERCGAELHARCKRGLCKKCNHARIALEWYERNRQRVLDSNKQRQSSAEGKAARVTHLNTQRQTHPEKLVARRAVNNALRDGKLERQPCEVCGTTPAHGHHDDYSKPLDVRWLCHAHHMEAHGKKATARTA